MSDVVRRVLVFDLGGVLVDPSTLNEDLAAILHVDAEEFRSAYWVRRLDYDLDLAAEDYWDDVLARLQITATPEQRASLIRVDSEGWTSLRPDAHDLIEGLHASGERIAILSNATKEMGAVARASSWAPFVADWFFSAEIGLAKPHAALYRHVAEALEARPADILYFEDVPRGVDVADSLGWGTHLWVSQGEAEALLRSMGVVPRAGDASAGVSA